MIMRDDRCEPSGQCAFLDVPRLIKRGYAFRWTLLCLLLLMPTVASADSVKEQAFKSLQCGEMERYAAPVG